ncbi:MAG: B12-binding domain-containing radical SAM protein [Phycisphaerae bacterium]|nr:B12-binding domain-containing radical SAM protein [Phycisphaerae bacterium]
MRIALVNPIARRTQGYHTIGSKIPQLGLQVLAQLTPREHHVDIIDEIFGNDCTDRVIRRGNYDLVGLTSYTSGATRAYEIAAQCRREGIPCILGGPHASAVPEESAQHFDSVAIGECDEIYGQILADAAAGRLQKFYRGGLPDLDVAGRGRARQELQPINGQYDVSAIQTSRGCPVGCEYCSVTSFNGAPIRRRRTEDIVEEWFSTTKPFIFVVDDNFFGVGERHAIWAKQLLREIIAEGHRRNRIAAALRRAPRLRRWLGFAPRLWFSQTTINMGDDPAGMSLAAEAGCVGMLVGFETFNSDNLKEFHKGINRKNLERYQTLVRGFQRHGVSVFGGFIIGADADDENTVAATALQAVQLGIDTIQITNLTPLPGTKMYDRYMAEGRVFATNYPQDWERYTFVETVYHPKNMTAAKLDECIYELRNLAARENWVWKRTLRTLWRTRSLTTAMFIHGMNSGWKRMARVQAPRDEERYGVRLHRSVRTETIREAFGLFQRRWVPARLSVQGSPVTA